MPKPTPPPDHDAPPPRLSRWRAAWRVLRGDPLVPEQIMQDWLNYRLLFDDLLKRWGAMLARQAKADHARLREQLAAEPTHREPAKPRSRKEEVRARAAELRGLAPLRRSVGVAPVPELNNRVAALLPPEPCVDCDDDHEEDEDP